MLSEDDAKSNTFLEVIPENIPSELLARDQFVLWKAIPNPSKGKPDKVPYDPKQRSCKAKSNDPSTWASAKLTIRAYERDPRGWAGLGYQMGKNGTPSDIPGLWLIGIDLDNCRNPETGELDERAQRIVTEFDTYTEISPSGRGLRLFVWGKRLPAHGRKSGDGVEMYDAGRFLTLTGNRLPGTPDGIKARPDEVAALHAKIWPDVAPPAPRPLPDPASLSLEDADILNRCFATMRQYKSESEEDLALCRRLAFWTGGDEQRIDALYRQSGLYRDKWNERHRADGATYGEMTIERAIASCTAFYSPSGGKSAINATITRAREWAARADWKAIAGRGRSNARKAFLVALEYMRGCCNEVAHLSARDIAMMGGMGVAAACRALKKLVVAGVLVLVNSSNGFDANIYGLGEACRSGTLYVDTCLCECSTSAGIDFDTLLDLAPRDGFLHGARVHPQHTYGELLPTWATGAAEVIAALVVENGLSISEIAEATGLNPRTVAAKVKALYAEKLVVVKRMGRCKVVTLRPDWKARLDRTAPRFTTNGLAAHRRDKIERDRMERAQSLAFVVEDYFTFKRDAWRERRQGLSQMKRAA